MLYCVVSRVRINYLFQDPSNSNQNIDIISYHDRIYCRTSINKFKFEYLWEIDHFFSFCKFPCHICSKPFPRMDFHKIVMMSNSNGKIQFHLLTKNSFFGAYRVFHVDPQHQHEALCKHYVGPLKTMLLCEIPKNADVIPYNYTQKITMRFVFEIFDESSEELHGVGYPKPIPLRRKPSNCHQRNSAGLIFKVGEKLVTLPLISFRNHATFMSQCEARKNSEDQVVLDDDSVAVEYMLQYFQSGALPLISSCDMLQKLMELAHGYDIPELQSECEFRLMKKLDTKNVIQLYFLSYRLNAKDLTKYISHYIHFCLEEITSTSEFQTLSLDDKRIILNGWEQVHIETYTEKFVRT